MSPSRPRTAPKMPDMTLKLFSIGGQKKLGEYLMIPRQSVPIKKWIRRPTSAKDSHREARVLALDM